jgi:hypothetical protein
MGSQDRSSIRFPAGLKDFSLLHNVQTGSGVQPTFRTIGTGVCFPGGKAAGECSLPLTST